MCRVLVEYRKDLINQVDKDGWSPLHAAVYWSKYEAAELLVENGADMALTTDRVRGWCVFVHVQI